MELDLAKRIIIMSIKRLVKFDDDIFKQKMPSLTKATEKERVLNRELHETTLNHRLAVYIEQVLKLKKVTGYHVDIEYNRNFSNPKFVNLGEVRIPVRPDILVHKRMDKTPDAHLFVIEAKKHITSSHDINKIKGFLTDPEYLYKYGLTISYAYNPRQVSARLYFTKGDTIQEHAINVNRMTKIK